jgi:hypothetical protein
MADKPGFFTGRPPNEVFGKIRCGEGGLLSLPDAGVMSSYDRGCNAPIALDLGKGVVFVPLEISSEEVLARRAELRRRTKNGTGSPH